MAGPSDDGEKTRDYIIGSTGYNCYSEASSNGNSNIQTHLVLNPLQNFGPTGPDIYNLSTGVENMLGFPSKNTHHDQNGPVSWKGFFTKPPPGGNPPSSKEVSHESGFYNQHDLTEVLLVHEDPSSSSLRSCVFPCEGNERPSHGLSLSLSSSNPANIGLQSFELRQQHDELFRFGPSCSRPVDNIPEHAYIKNSRYLAPAQELLSEFCNLGTKVNDDETDLKMKSIQKNSEWQNTENAIKMLHSLDLLELQRRKTKLLQMLEEVDRRYKYYCDQMRAVISSFDSLAGNGAAAAYSASASKAMSRHFRCLKDGILSQIKATKKAMGEKDTAVLLGTVKGETPRLRLLDQTHRQQRALQQMSNMEIHPWRPQRGLPERSVSVLRAWLFEHFLHPVSNWFINARVRLWKPMVEEMYLEEQKEDQLAPNDVVAQFHDNIGIENHTMNMNPSDQKPTHDQLARIHDSECLSSIVNNPDRNDAGSSRDRAIHQNHEHLQNPISYGRLDSFGAMEYDFCSYGTGHSAASASATSYGGGVSLTLGLHQDGGASGGGAMNLPFLDQSSLFYPRSDDHRMEDCQTVQYSLLDGESQNLPYRNLMDAQLLHDLTG
ncbi:hypothetical protein OROGR_026855 [Orobanche gracilis]